MKRVVALLLLVWLVVAVVAVVLEGLLWLGAVALVLVAATAAWGVFKLRAVVSRD